MLLDVIRSGAVCCRSREKSSRLTSYPHHKKKHRQVKLPVKFHALFSAGSIFVYLCLSPSCFSMEAPANSTTNNHTSADDPWEITDKIRLRRFLCYGSEGDIFTAKGESHVSVDNAEALLSLLQEEEGGAEVVEEIRRFVQEGLAVRLGPTFFALALCSQHSKLNTRKAAFKALKDICSDPAHLFAVIQYKKELRERMECGIWGRALRKAVSDWYNKQDAMALAATVTRCRQREGWSHKDLLRLSHTKPSTEGELFIFSWCRRVTWKYPDRIFFVPPISRLILRIC